MATEDQYLNSWRGVGSRSRSQMLAAATMAAGVTVQGSFSIPQGSWVTGVRFETPTAFSGAPTNINARLGTSGATGAEVVADTDVKAQGHITATVVAAFDVIGNNATTIYYQVATNGGTNPAGTVNVILEYAAPVR